MVTIVFLYFVFVNLDVKELIRIIKNFNPIYIIFLVISIITGLTARALCFKMLMSKTANLPIKEMAPLCITGAALNIVLPARAGDIFRAFWVGQKYNINKLKVFGTVMLERMFDTFVIFCFLIICVTFYHRNPLAMNLCIFAGVTMSAFAIFAFISFKYNKTDVICNYLISKTKNFPFSEHIHKLISFVNKTCNSFFNGFEIMDSPLKLLGVICSSFTIWAVECLNFYIVLSAFGYHLHWSVTLFIICFIALACMVPSTSIFIGPYQMAVIAAFSIYDVGKESALAISFVEQAVVVITTSVVATIFLLQNNISYKELKQDIKQKAE